jgi:hypothetical protein
MRYTYSDPIKTHNGLWRSVINKDGRTVEIVDMTTKKSLQDYLRKHKEKALKGECE